MSKKGHDMKNLIQNERWCQGPSGTPSYFTNTGPITYDNLVIQGYRTCSSTMENNTSAFASNQYDNEISVCYQRAIVFGYSIRGIYVDTIYLQAEFFDASNHLLEVCKKDIAREIECDFCDVTGTFPIPCGAVRVKLSLQIRGKTTALTFFGPFAYFC